MGGEVGQAESIKESLIQEISYSELVRCLLKIYAFELLQQTYHHHRDGGASVKKKNYIFMLTNSISCAYFIINWLNLPLGSRQGTL